MTTSKHLLLSSGFEGITKDAAKHMVAHTALPMPVSDGSVFDRDGFPHVVGWLTNLTMRANQHAWAVYGDIEWSGGYVPSNGQAPFVAVSMQSVDRQTGEDRGAKIVDVALTAHPLITNMPELKL